MMFNMLFPAVCYFVFVYPVFRLSNWYFPGDGVSFIQSLLLWGASLGGMYYSFSGPKMKVRYLVVHWMGVSFVFACLTLIGELIRLVAPLTNQLSDQTIVTGILLSGVVLVIGAVAFSHHLAVKNHDVYSKKVSRSYRVGQISDVHIGSRQGGYMRRIVNRLNQLELDCVVITGDLIDSSAVDYEALESIGLIDAKTYFIIGNHERYADLDKILDIIQRLGVRTLRQESDSHHELVFTGIDDADRKDQVEIHLPSIEQDQEKFNILLYHRPLGWESAMEHGIDLMLSGHTHNGQIFPFNYVVKQQFSRIRGMYINQHHHLYVSSGTGTWGPLMRLGSLNEISVMQIRPH